jgi:hypothetical protein
MNPKIFAVVISTEKSRRSTSMFWLLDPARARSLHGEDPWLGVMEDDGVSRTFRLSAIHIFLPTLQSQVLTPTPNTLRRLDFEKMS